jgi:hypothetical protein
MNSEFSFAVLTEMELTELLAGHEVGIPFSWPSYHTTLQLKEGFTGVVWKKGSHSTDPIQPLVLVAREEDIRRLVGRFALLRSNLSPLTSWCHLFTQQRFEKLKSPRREPDLSGLQAAWSGLVVAEAQILSDKTLASLRLPACLATQTFAIARASAIWGDASESEIVRRFNAANSLFRTDRGPAHRGEIRIAKVRSALQPIWATLNALLHGRMAASELRPLVASLNALQNVRHFKDRDEAERVEAEPFARPLAEVIPEARTLFHLSDLTPEKRLKIFDQLVMTLNGMDQAEPSLQRSALALLAGYLTTVAAGGTPTLSLAESQAQRWPEIMGWAYAVGGIGERVFWTSTFDGLGRLVARELMRPFDLDEPPSCDFALDEASVLVDSKLEDPLVHLRIKQGKIATIALLPGVNIANSINDLPAQDLKPQFAQPVRHTEGIRDNRGIWGLIADSIWPHIRTRVEEYIQDSDFDSAAYRRSRNKRKSTGSQLALRGSKK